MKRLILALAVLTWTSACREEREQAVPSSDESAQYTDLTLPDPQTGDHSDSLATNQAVSPVEEEVNSAGARIAPKGASPEDTTPEAPVVTPPPKTPSRPSSADTSRPLALDTGSTPASDTIVGPPSPTTASTGATPPRKEQLRGLPSGTEIHAALGDSIHSRHDTAGRTVDGHVMQNVTGPDGKTILAAGTPVRFTVTRLRSARSKSSQGRLALRVDGVTIAGQFLPVQAEVRPVQRELRGRGVTSGDAAKVGVGAVGGAVLGRVIGGNTKGAVIGGVVGAAGGAVVANQTATRDVVVNAKTPVVFVLTRPLMVR